MGKHSDLSVEELKSKLKAMRTTQVTCGCIFALIILAWIVLGYWQTNIPVFIITVVMGLILVSTTGASAAGLRAEIAKKSSDPNA